MTAPAVSYLGRKGRCGKALDELGLLSVELGNLARDLSAAALLARTYAETPDRSAPLFGDHRGTTFRDLSPDGLWRELEHRAKALVARRDPLPHLDLSCLPPGEDDEQGRGWAVVRTDRGPLRNSDQLMVVRVQELRVGYGYDRPTAKKRRRKVERVRTGQEVRPIGPVFPTRRHARAWKAQIVRERSLHRVSAREHFGADDGPLNNYW